jgi:hypothetical protein
MGADPNAGGITCLAALLGVSEQYPADTCAQIGEALLQHGADCLLPTYSRSSTRSMLVHAISSVSYEPHSQGIAELLVSHLERQHAARQLQLSSAAQASELLLAVTRWGHQQLFSYSLGSLEAHLAAAGGTWS